MNRLILITFSLFAFHFSLAQNVGIGTANPQTKLSIQDDRPVVSLLSPVSGRSMRVEYYEVGDGELRFQTGAADGGFTSGVDDAGTIVSMQRRGNVGIGTVLTAARLDVVGTATGTRSLLLRSGNTSLGTASQQILFGYNNTAEYMHNIRSRHNAGTQAGNAIDFYLWHQGTNAAADVGSRHIMTLNGNGRVGIGYTAPTTTLDVAGNGRFNGGLFIGDAGFSYNIPNSCGGNHITNADFAIYSPDNTGGCGDEAYIAHYVRAGAEATTFEIGVQNDGDDHINLNPSGELWVAGQIPIQFQRYNNLGDNINFNTGFPVANYCAAIVGMRARDVDTQENGTGDALRARMENVGGNWHIQADWRSHNKNETWDVDVMFITRKMCSLTGY